MERPLISRLVSAGTKDNQLALRLRLRLIFTDPELYALITLRGKVQRGEVTDGT